MEFDEKDLRREISYAIKNIHGVRCVPRGERPRGPFLPVWGTPSRGLSGAPAVVPLGPGLLPSRWPCSLPALLWLTQDPGTHSCVPSAHASRGPVRSPPQSIPGGAGAGGPQPPCGQRPEALHSMSLVTDTPVSLRPLPAARVLQDRAFHAGLGVRGHCEKAGGEAERALPQMCRPGYPGANQYR